VTVLGAAGIVVAALVASAPCAAQAPAAGAAKRVVKLGNHLRVDLAKRRISMDAEVCLRSGALELLVCGKGTKEHESVMSTRAKASHLHAGLLLLGLTPGKPAEWVMLEGDDHGRALPPRGAALGIAFRWREPGGRVTQVDASKFLACGNKKGPMPDEWIFVGSDIFADGTYWADSEGEILCVANFASAVIDVPFKNPNKQAQQMMDFVANTDAIPAVGTPVEVIIVPKPGAEKAPHARATLEIDPRGRFRLDGRGIARTALRDRAAAFIDQHSRGMVMVQAHPGAMVADIVYARDELTLGGIQFIRHRWVGVGEPILPKTDAQKTEAMKTWAEKFANPRDFIVEPSRDAAEELKRIEDALADLKARQALLQKYRAELDKAAVAYKATTRPARPSPE